jgi:hypothetical protein
MSDAQLRDLMHLFDFTAEDLAANRQGVLSARQQQHLRAGAAPSGAALAPIVLAGAAGVCSSFAGVTGIANFFAEAPLEARLLALAVGVLAMIGAVVFIRMATLQAAQQVMTRRSLRAAAVADADGGRVERVSGALVYDEVRYLDNGTLDHWEVGGERFAFIPEQHSALLDGDAYTVYLAPTSRVIVAIEPEAPAQPLR